MNTSLYNSNSTITNREVGKLCHIWQNLQNTAFAIKPIHSKKEYKQALGLMETLLRTEKENSSLTDLIEILGILINNYEDEKVQVGHANSAEVLTFLMDEHDLHQKDLPEVGSQGVVSEILSGQRELNKRQIIALADRFGVSPSVFM